jgi:two-component system, sensor histidine kinase RpfC
VSLTATWQSRRSGAIRPELEQARLRLAIALMVSLCVIRYLGGDGYASKNEWSVLAGLAGWLVLSIGILAAIWIGRSESVALRLLGILADVGAITWGLFAMGEGGVVLVSAYLLVIFGNGFRYGRRYLQASQFLTLVGFSIALLFSDFWSHHLSVGVCFMLALIILPVYVGLLTRRIAIARKRADEANEASAAESAREKDRLLAYVSRETGEPLNAVIAEYNEGTCQEGQ